VDDDRETLDLLSLYLTEQGFVVSCVESGEAMDAWLDRNTADLVVLDLMLPGEDGLSIARRLSSQPNLPIVMISARGEELDRIVGLEVGADDYLPKPFNPRELLARIRAVLRRSGATEGPTSKPDSEYSFPPFRFDPERRALYRGDAEVELSRAELDNLSGRGRDPFDRSIDVRVTRLRHKIEEDPAEPKLIRTVWGVGYQFTPQGHVQ
jgi:DNA-binding response OmpR family regulator